MKLCESRHQRLEVLQPVVQHEADRADHVVMVVLDRHAGHDEVLAAELHDVEQDRLAGLRHLPHHAVGDDLLDRAAERLAGIVEAEHREIFVVDVDHAAAAVDGDRALAQALQPLEQRLHGAPMNLFGVAGELVRNTHEPCRSSHCARRLTALADPSGLCGRGCRLNAVMISRRL